MKNGYTFFFLLHKEKSEKNLRKKRKVNRRIIFIQNYGKIDLPFRPKSFGNDKKKSFFLKRIQVRGQTRLSLFGYRVNKKVALLGPK